ncbi:phage scaffolding protein [Lactobacillus sp. ESL0680]|uniref:phage scaffolding protein n=1 Tax=Lactobacillus sp. ESL0680 TaxID=2983210 RepID=UPI0023F72200|nr:phage scaffolding protein [Lactobacillus sp. ESL0680]WEV39274.1 phage scaffolding protein [Lactobacillus sp. ESL0680]
MKREDLEKLGLSGDVIDKVIIMHGEDVNAIKAKSTELEETNKSLTEQIANRDKDLKKLQKQVKDNDDVSDQLKDLQAQYKQDTAKLNEQLSQTKLNNAIDQSLTQSKVRNTKAAKALLNMDNIKLDEQGNLIGLDEQVKGLKQSDAYLFDEGSKQPYTPANGQPTGNDETQTMTNIFTKGLVNNDDNN